MVSPITVRQWAQKGDLRAQVTPGGHRRFLRRDVEQFASARGLALNIPGDGGQRILIVDDDEQFAGLLKEFLESFPVDIGTALAHDGFAAGRQIETFKPHVVLLDLMMPGMDGFAVCKSLKESPTTKAIRVLAMTGYCTDENRKRILGLDAEVCLAKPFDLEQLAEMLGLSGGTS